LLSYFTKLSKQKILKLIDGVKLAEMKIIWRWSKKKLSQGLNDIIIENNNRVLRHRQFIRDPSWTAESIANRLAKRAFDEISNIEIARSINELKNKIKKTCFLVDYTTQCNIRNCYICSL
jgi:hypothetical protein